VLREAKRRQPSGITHTQLLLLLHGLIYTHTLDVRKMFSGTIGFYGAALFSRELHCLPIAMRVLTLLPFSTFLHVMENKKRELVDLRRSTDSKMDY
jgi:hypothetical protein